MRNKNNGSWIFSTLTVLVACYLIYIVAKIFMKSVSKEKKMKKHINGNKVNNINTKVPFNV